MTRNPWMGVRATFYTLLEPDMTVQSLYDRLGVVMPPAGRDAHSPSRFRVHVSVLLAEAVAA